MNIKSTLLALWALLTLLALAATAQAASVNVAVAANFAVPMQRIAQQFERETGFRAVLSVASTGRLYAQIRHGAPFDVMLSADDRAPARLIEGGHAVAGTRFTYAIGRLVLWSRDPNLVDAEGAVLRSAPFTRIALADPKVAPYGAAAVETMTHMGVWSGLQARAVFGDSIAQAYHFAASQNAQLGFVALSQVFVEGQLTSGSAWVVPQSFYTPIRQDAVLLQRGAANPAATALLAYLRTEPALTIIRAFGYDH
jgi:molybdate transport system substrate-binding protein